MSDNREAVALPDPTLAATPFDVGPRRTIDLPVSTPGASAPVDTPGGSGLVAGGALAPAIAPEPVEALPSPSAAPASEATAPIPPPPAPAPVAGSAAGRYVPQQQGATPALPAVPPDVHGVPPNIVGPAESGRVIADGDSIGYGLAKFNHLAGNTQPGANPEVVFNNIQKNLQGDPSYYQGATVLLSPGTMNMGVKPEDQSRLMGFIPRQIQAIKAAGGNVVLVGADQGRWAAFNDELKKIADQSQVQFGGPLPTRDVHPGGQGYKSYYQQFNLPVGGAPTALPTEGYQVGQRATELGPPRFNPGAGADPRGLVPYIRETAIKYGVDPDLAVLGSYLEGLGNPVGDNGKSHGAFQLYTGGGVGNKFIRDTGLDPADPRNEKATIDYALQYISQHGWGEWNGPKNAGITGMMGINGNPYPASLLTRGGRGGGGGDGGGGGGFRGGGQQLTDAIHTAVVNKDPNQMLSVVQSVPTAPGFNGNTAQWMTLETQMVSHAISQGHLEKIPLISDMITKFAYQGMNMNLMDAWRAMARGDVGSTAGYLKRAYQFFPDFADAQFKTDGKGNLFAQQVGEINGQPIGQPIQITPDKIMQQMVFTRDPMTFMKFLSDQQKSNAQAQNLQSQANYRNGLNQTNIARSVITQTGALQRTRETNLTRERIAEMNQGTKGVTTDQQLNTAVEKMLEGFSTTGFPGGVQAGSPEADQLSEMFGAIARGAANTTNRQQYTTPEEMKGLMGRVASSLKSGKLQVQKTNQPGVVALVDSGKVLATVPEAVAQKYLTRGAGQTVH